MIDASLSLSLSRPPLRYHGSKWRIAPWIASHFPHHHVYVEAFGGGGGVLLRKPRSPIEVYNDLDGDVVNFFRVLRDRSQCTRLARTLALTPYARTEYDRSHSRTGGGSVERARRLAIRAFMGYGSNAGTRRSKCGFRGADWSSRQANNLSWMRLPDTLVAAHRRLQGVVIERLEARQLLPKQDSPRTLFYLDPPYLASTRTNRAKDHSYRHEMTDRDHVELLEMAQGLAGFVLISAYHSPLYDRLLRGWPHVEKAALTQGNARSLHRTEVLWLSPRTAEALQGSLFAVGEHNAARSS